VRFDPFLPAGDVAVLCLLKTIAETGNRIPSRHFRFVSKTERQYELPVRFRQINFGNHGHIAVFRPRILPGHLFVRLQILPAIRRADIADRPLDPRGGACQSQRIAAPLRK
jgi:hypothetical protein